MSRLGRAQLLCLGLFLPLLIVCIGLSIVQQLTGRIGYVRVSVHAPENENTFPLVRSVLDERASHSGLQPGDALLEVGDRSLRGAGSYRFYAWTLAAASADRRARIAFERDGERMETTLDVAPRSRVREIRGVLIGIWFGLLSTLVLLRAPDDRRSLPLFVGYVFYGLNQAWYPGGPPWITYAWLVTFAVGQAVFLPFWMILNQRWLNRPLKTWEYFLPWVFAPMALVRNASMTELGMPASVALPLFLIGGVVGNSIIVGYIVYNFRTGDILERRRLRWPLYCCLLAAVPVLTVSLVAAVDSSWYWLRPWLQYLVLLVPLGVTIAIVRYDLFDIDRLIGATATYTVLGILLLAGLLLLAPAIGETMSVVLGIPPGTGQTLASLGLAGVLVPGHRYLRPRVDRLLFKERAALQRGIDRLLFDLSGCESPEQLIERAGEGLDTLVRSDLCSIFTRAGGAYAPAYVRGSAVPPVLAGDGPLIAMLETARGPVRVEGWRRRAPIDLSPVDRAALETLGAAVLLPVHYANTVGAVVCLGTKRSGDIYTPTDLALLGRVSDRVSAELARFDDAEVIRQSRAMQESLRHYVPGAIAAELSSGESLEAGELEVSVLFVDLRGYTALSEGRRPQDVFATVNRYTETVSRVVQAHGGSIVEFNGDGMMAVFGAPRPLEAPERSAVQAGRAIVHAVGELAPEGGDAGAPNLSAGVGVATGPAYVGNIQAVDRMIWSAIGNTTNLAARLEALTRDLDADIVIDEATWREAGDAARGFERLAAASIRGRSDKLDLYVLARAAPAAPPRRAAARDPIDSSEAT